MKFNLNWINEFNSKILLFLMLCLFVLESSKAQPCNSNGDLIIFSNYDGGELNIDVDVNIPNLKIGICSYEPVKITISGLYSSNVSEVMYAGFNSTQNNNNCGIGNFPTSITGVPVSNQTILTIPPVVSTNPNGYNFGIICGYSCDNNTNQGGCNTIDQIVNYFGSSLGGTLYSLTVQYNCWLNSTTYSVSSLVGQCCTLPSNLPVANFSTSNLTICQGECINFQDLSTNSPTNYNWSFAGANILSSSDQNPQNICFNSSGSFEVSLTASNSAGSSTTSQTITVLPAIISPTVSLSSNSGNPYCLGDTITITANVANGGTSPTYAWTLNDLNVGTNANSFTSSGLNDGDTLEVVVTSNEECLVSITDSESYEVEIFEVPVLNTSSTPSSCQGILDGSVSVNVVSGSPAQSYFWNTNPPSTLQTVTNLASGAYSVVVTYGNGCTVEDDVVVNSSSITLSSSVVIGQSSNDNPNGSISITVTGGQEPYGFFWNTNPNQYTNNATGLSAGTYSCTVSDANGCSSVFEIVIPNFVGIEELKQSDFFIEPNPVLDVLIINWNSTNKEEMNFSIFDINGRTLMQKQINFEMGNRQELNIGELSSGIYYLELSNKNNKVHKKILKL